MTHETQQIVIKLITSNMPYSKEQMDLIKQFVEYQKKLEHHKDATVGLWATDRKDAVEDTKGVMFQIKF